MKKNDKGKKIVLYILLKWESKNNVFLRLLRRGICYAHHNGEGKNIWSCYN